MVYMLLVFDVNVFLTIMGFQTIFNLDSKDFSFCFDST